MISYGRENFHPTPTWEREGIWNRRLQSYHGDTWPDRKTRGEREKKKKEGSSGDSHGWKLPSYITLHFFLVNQHYTSASLHSPFKMMHLGPSQKSALSVKEKKKKSRERDKGKKEKKVLLSKGIAVQNIYISWKGWELYDNCQNGWVRIKKAKLKWLGFTNKPKDRVHKEKHALIKIKYCILGLHSVGREDWTHTLTSSWTTSGDHWTSICVTRTLSLNSIPK